MTPRVRHGFRELEDRSGERQQKVIDIDREILSRMQGYGGVFLPSSYVVFIECSG